MKKSYSSEIQYQYKSKIDHLFHDCNIEEIPKYLKYWYEVRIIKK